MILEQPLVDKLRGIALSHTMSVDQVESALFDVKAAHESLLAQSLVETAAQLGAEIHKDDIAFTPWITLEVPGGPTQLMTTASWAPKTHTIALLAGHRDGMVTEVHEPTALFTVFVDDEAFVYEPWGWDTTHRRWVYHPA